MSTEGQQWQLELHRQNQERMSRLEDQLTKTLEVSIRTEENTRSLPDVIERVEALEHQISKAKGAMVVIGSFGGVLGAAIGAAIEWLLHRVIK